MPSSVPSHRRVFALVTLALGASACAAGTAHDSDASVTDAPAADAPAGDTARADDVATNLDAGLDANTDQDFTPDNTPDGAAPSDAPAPVLAVNTAARVTADFLNLRQGPSTSDAIITAMPCGSMVQIVGGPTGSWWNVTFNSTTGWSSGNYLVPESSFDPAVCMMGMAAPDAGTMPGDGGIPPVDPTGIFMRAQLGVGYSYYWGHGSWRDDGASHGSCSGTCPSCTHTGVYGADCSGFVAKVWQIPRASALTDDLHPYSTYNFYNETTHWSQVPRSDVQPGDAMVYNASGHGHIFLFESGSDPWGSIWTYEARGCSTGVVHNLRTAGTQYVTIRREAM